MYVCSREKVSNKNTNNQEMNARASRSTCIYRLCVWGWGVLFLSPPSNCISVCHSNRHTHTHTHTQSYRLLHPPLLAWCLPSLWPPSQLASQPPTRFPSSAIIVLHAHTLSHPHTHICTNRNKNKNTRHTHHQHQHQKPMIDKWIETLRRGECIKEHELKKLCRLVRIYKHPHR